MGKKLANAPVYYTVIQIQFNQRLDLNRFVPDIQPKMRELHFPDFKKQVVQRFDLPVMLTADGQIAPPTVTAFTRYMFADIAGNTAFILDSNSLVLLTTAYDNFNVFLDTYLQGLDIIHKALQIDLTEKIGIRYLDAVQPAGTTETLADYLIPQVLGMSLHGHGQLQHAFSETTIATETGHLVSRVVVRNGPIGLPVDLTETPLQSIHPRCTSYQGIHSIIDTDAYTSKREAFDLQRITQQLTALHGEITTSFNAMVTDHARAVWA